MAIDFSKDLQFGKWYFNVMFLSIVLIWILREQFSDNGRMREVIDLKHKNSKY